MNILIFINIGIFLLIFIMLFANFLRHYINRKVNKIVHFLFIIGIISLFIAIMLLCWWLNLLEYQKRDYYIIYSAYIFLNSLILFFIIYYLTGNRRLLWFLFLYGISFFSLLSSVSFMDFVMIVSLSFLLFIFLYFSIRFNVYRKAVYAGIFYSSVSLLAAIFNEIFLKNLLLISLIQNAIFIVFLFIFIRELKKSPPVILHKPQKEESYLVSFIKYFVFVVVLANFIFLGTIAIHELGHFAVSKFYNCEYRGIIYQENLPHTELLCENHGNNTFLLLGGFLLPFIISLFMFIIQGKFIKEVATLVLGFTLIISYSDFVQLGLSGNIAFILLLTGIFFVVLGIALLAKLRIEEYA